MDVHALKDHLILEHHVNSQLKVNALLFLTLFGLILSAYVDLDLPKLDSSVYAMELRMEISVTNAHTNKTLNLIKEQIFVNVKILLHKLMVFVLKKELRSTMQTHQNVQLEHILIKITSHVWHALQDV